MSPIIMIFKFWLITPYNVLIDLFKLFMREL